MIPDKVNLADLGATLEQPFVLHQIARVDHFALYAYLCLGTVAAHRHLTQDELFYVYSGALRLETDLGQVDLSPRELTVVPAGLSHVSGAASRTLVVLGQAAGDPDRRNGHGRIVAEAEQRTLQKISVANEVERLGRPFEPLPIARIDDMLLRLIWCQGATTWHQHAEHDELLWLEEGRIEIGTENGPAALGAGELLVIPHGRIHRLAAQQHSVALSLMHDSVAPPEQMGQEGG